MFKSVFAAVAALSVSAGAAVAGPYVEVEANSGWRGNDYKGTTTDLHVGYEGDLGDNADWFIQAGPALVAESGEDMETEISGKAGLGVDLTEQLTVYGEIGFETANQSFSEDLGFGTKLGATYRF